MLRKIILKKLASVEKQLGESVDYLRHVVRVSLPAFFKFTKILPISNYRKSLPAEAYHVARIVATRDEDCGACVQIEVNSARQSGINKDILQAVLTETPEDLPEELANVYRFAEAVVKATSEDEPLRRRIRDAYGEEGLVELSLAIASCRFFPIMKRTLGYSKSCKLVEIEYE
ncbi:hypothetical protein GWO43_01770 [candidate division KSB1 bacterium]|nr:hypothetical protein [candidate division KSB1 bacterium]NIR69455.1 hypothetical protein [candidate division KSB1 bacterium]NIS22804.1 hypothetical protein [candidate division KSB1 bacterium]NIT69644.1 hypothetical protein [candidate division KSB1 bacterium]NIU23313.1 hypothetical protein [candidate division KSB1 bacterium]